MAHISSGESSKPHSPQKAFIMGELATTKRSLTQKEEEMRQLEERLQRLETAQVRQPRRWEHMRVSRSYNQYGSHEEDEDWRMNQFDERRQHQHYPSKVSFPYVKLYSFSGESEPNIYLGWEAKVDQIFNVHEVQEDQKVKLASLEFLDYAMQWWHKTVMDIRLNKRPVVVFWYDLKEYMRARFVLPYYRKELLLKLQRLQQGPRT